MCLLGSNIKIDLYILLFLSTETVWAWAETRTEGILWEESKPFFLEDKDTIVLHIL